VIQDFGTNAAVDWNAIHTGNGIGNIKTRARVIGAKINFESKLGYGTKVEIEVSLPT
jgi:signal transduction histidine kinase